MCAYCPEVFLGKQSLHIHTHRHHGTGKIALKQFTCDMCQITFAGKRRYVAHCKEVHDEIVPIHQGNLLRGNACVQLVNTDYKPAYNSHYC